MASYIDETRLRCRTPSALSARSAFAFDTTFDTLSTFILAAPRHYMLPSLVTGALQLTRPDFNYVGSALLSPAADPLAFRAFIASFTLSIDAVGESSGESVSFCAGSLTAPLFDFGVSNALCIAVVHTPPTHIRVEQGGYPLVTIDAFIPIDGRWFIVEVALVDSRLSVRIDGRVFTNLTSPIDWSPSTGLRFGFTARTGSERVSRHLVDDVRIVAGSILVGTGVPVEIALNGQQFTTGGPHYRFLSEPHITSVAPISGPVGGGTRVTVRVRAASAFSEAGNIVCIFNETEVAGTWDGSFEVVSCYAPPSNRGPVIVTASIEIEGHTLRHGQGSVYTYYPDIQLERVSPYAGPAAGGTEIIVYGKATLSGPGPLLCRIANETLPATLEVYTGSVLCVTPVMSAQSLPVEVSLNGQQYQAAEDATFLFYSPPILLSVTPKSGSVAGSTPVTITGSGFLPQPQGVELCRWAHATTSVTFVNETHIICSTPVAPVGVVPLEVTMNGQQYTSAGLNFSRYSDPHVHRLSWPGNEGELDSWLEPKVTLPQAGFVLVRAWGSAFAGGSDYRCQINAEEPIAATYDPSSDCILCWSDLWVEGTNTVEVTLNGLEYTTSNASFFYNPFW